MDPAPEVQLPESRVLIIITGRSPTRKCSLCVRYVKKEEETDRETGGTICMQKSVNGLVPVSLVDPLLSLSTT